MHLKPEYGGKGQIRVLPPWDFTGGPVVKTLRFHCRGTDQSLAGERRARTLLLGAAVSLPVTVMPTTGGGCEVR